MLLKWVLPFIPLPPPAHREWERLLIIVPLNHPLNCNHKCKRACCNNFIPLLGCPQTQKLFQRPKIVPTSLHNPGTSFNFKIVSVLKINWPCKTYLKYFGKFSVFSMSGKISIQIPCFPVTWQSCINLLSYKNVFCYIAYLCDELSSFHIVFSHSLHQPKCTCIKSERICWAEPFTGKDLWDKARYMETRILISILSHLFMNASNGTLFTNHFGENK